jgi:hypothetical protein
VNTCTPGWIEALSAGAHVGAADAEAVAISTATVAAIVAARIRGFKLPCLSEID